MVVIPDYRVVIRDLESVPLDEVPAKNLQYSEALNDVGNCSFVLPINHEKCTMTLLDPGKREVVVYRDNALQWGGYLTRPEITVDENEDAQVRFSCDSWFSRFFRRYIKETLKYTNVDQLSIAWNLIQSVQNQTGFLADMGIVRHDPGESSGILRTRKYFAYERPVLGDSLRDISEMNSGFDFEVTPARRWKTFYPEKGVATDYIFEYGKNMGNLSFSGDSSDVISEITGLGAGEGRNRCMAVWRATETLNEFGLLQRAEEFENIKHYDAMSARVRSALRFSKYPRLQPQMTFETDDPPFGSWTLGDRIRVVADYGYIDINRIMKVVAQNVQVSDEGHEAIQVFFDDIPLTTDEVAE
jgi:hypothetical protein